MRAFLCSLALISLSASAASPLEAYQKRLSDSIGREWYLRVEPHRDQLKPGTTRITFAISREGTLQNLKILSNTSDERAAFVAVDSIKHANIQPPPTDAFKTKNVFEEDMKFTIYPK
jgi:hypothetical protein